MSLMNRVTTETTCWVEWFHLKTNCDLRKELIFSRNGTKRLYKQRSISLEKPIKLKFYDNYLDRLNHLPYVMQIFLPLLSNQESCRT